ncbi:MAG: citramalate synthase [Clostridiales bacterium]|jgi:2-isopropylmalate synthase|nr:citramalate synthase [Clostridiales bacterium]
MEKIEFLDSTLRDGAQMAGVSFSIQDKLKIIDLLDEFGIDIIEAGNPYSNPKDQELFRLLKDKKFKRSAVSVFGSTRKAGVKTSDDCMLAEIAGLPAEYSSIVGKCWDFHVLEVLRTTLEENLRMVYETVEYLTAMGKKVIFDAEHYFNSRRANPDYAKRVLESAVKAGACCLALCDTNGTFLPDEIYEIVKETVDLFGIPVGIHSHNDTGMAVAGSVMAVKAGAVHVQGTINGYGERCGNADLCTVIPNICFKLGNSCMCSESMGKLTYISKAVAETANMPVSPNAPYVGKNAFTHKAGMHSDAIAKATGTYEHIEPEVVGNHRKVLLSEVAGKSAVLGLINLIDSSIGKDSEETAHILRILKERELEGYQYEGAEGSFELLIRKTLGKYRSFFDLLHFKVIDEDKIDFKIMEPHDFSFGTSTAIVKIMVDGRTEITAAEGDGPVNAMDVAIRKALGKFYPSLNQMKLTDYKVRVLDSSAAAASKVRVLIESSDMSKNWATIGVSTNIIEASRQALVDSIEYKLLLDYERPS